GAVMFFALEGPKRTTGWFSPAPTTSNSPETMIFTYTDSPSFDATLAAGGNRKADFDALLAKGWRIRDTNSNVVKDGGVVITVSLNASPTLNRSPSCPTHETLQ